jgi:sugar phosphate isomerase/epimerase
MNQSTDTQSKGMTRRRFLAGMAAAGATLPITGMLNCAAQEQGDTGKICIFSKHLQFLDYEAMATTAAEIGFDGLDLTVRPGGHVLPEQVEQDLPKAVEAINKAGLKTYMITTAITDPNDPNTEKILSTASQLGIKYYRFGYLRYDKSKPIEVSLETHKTTLSELANLNKKHNIHGDYQNHAGTGVGGPVWDIWYLINDLDPKWIGCQYDVKHATQEGGSSWSLGLMLLNKFIKTTAIKDFLWVKEEERWHGEHVPLAEGMVNFPAYFKLVKQYNLTGPISMHFEYPLGGAESGRRELTMDKSKILAAYSKDLNILRGWLKEYVG